jgi:hypothetical protein
LNLNKFQLLLILVVLYSFSISKAQNPFQITISNTTFAATDSVLPFWFVANQHGRIQASNSFSNITDLTIGQTYNNTSKSKLGYSWGGNFVAAFGENNYYQLNQAFAGLSLFGWEIKGGMFYDEIRFAGLSTSNGNIAASGNARPVPKVRFATRGYKQFPFWQNWLSFKGEYEEGFLNDERYVDGAHLHHKNLYFKFQTSTSFNFKIGFEHFVMWGGTSQNENIGELPEGWNAYWHYVFAIPGGEDFPETDQKNIAGNQLGTYQFEMVKDFSKMEMTLYISHPWEDNSGLNLHNWPDNLLGLHLNIKNEKKLVTDVVYEFTNSRQQSIRDSIYSWDENSGQWKMNEYDDYFNNGIYVSGFTYQQQVMSSPLFYPIAKSNGISMGIRSNRLFAHHLGMRGNFSDFITWKGLLTYIQHLGTYSNPYTTSQKQISGLFEVHYINPGFPIQIGLSAAGDVGNYKGKNLGFGLILSKKW